MMMKGSDYYMLAGMAVASPHLGDIEMLVLAIVLLGLSLLVRYTEHMQSEIDEHKALLKAETGEE